MRDLKSRVVRYLGRGIEEGPRPDGRHPVAVAYLEERYSSCLRIRGKRLCRELMEASGPGVMEARELACFLAEALLGGNDLMKADATVALRPFAKLLPKPSTTNIRVAKGELRKALSRLREDEDVAKLLVPAELAELFSAMLRHDQRNKNFNACQRLMELREDALLDGHGSLAEKVDEDRLQEDCSAFAKHFLKEKGSTAEARAYYGVSSEADDAGFWKRVFLRPLSEETKRLTSCALYIAAATFVKNLGSDRTRDLPLDLMGRYLDERAELGGATQVDDEEVLRLIASMDDDRYAKAVVPLSIDSRTGGGLFVMGRDHIMDHCLPAQIDEMPKSGASPVLIDYSLGTPFESDVEGAVRHACRVKLPICDLERRGLGVEGWRQPFDDLRRLFTIRARPDAHGAERQVSFWNSYYEGNGTQDDFMPADCPDVFKAYFEPAEKHAHGIRLEDYPPDADEQTCAVVPQCLVEYLRKERAEDLGGRLYDVPVVLCGRAPVSCEDALVRMASLYRDGKAFADYLPCVVQSKRSQDRWLEIISDALELDDFMRFYLGYLVRFHVLKKGKEAKACEWLANGEIDEESDMWIGSLSKQVAEGAKKRGSVAS